MWSKIQLLSTVHYKGTQERAPQTISYIPTIFCKVELLRYNAVCSKEDSREDHKHGNTEIEFRVQTTTSPTATCALPAFSLRLTVRNGDFSSFPDPQRAHKAGGVEEGKQGWEQMGEGGRHNHILLGEKSSLPSFLSPPSSLPGGGRKTKR